MTRERNGLQALHALQARVGSNRGLRAAVAEAPEDDGKTHAELWLYGIVGGYWFGFNAKSVGDQLRGLNVDNLTVRIHSPGGDAFEGIAIANLLRNHKANVTVVVDGLAASAASVIAIAGDDVVMSPGSQYMLHDGSTYLYGNEKDLRAAADWIGKQSQNIAEQYALRAGGTAESWRAVMTAEPDGTWYTAQESIDAKLADRIGTVVAVTAAPETPELPDESDDLYALALLELSMVHSAARAAWNPHLHASLAGSSAPARAPKPPTAPADGSTHTEGGSAVAFSDAQMTTLRSTLGLAEDANEEAILAALEDVVDQATEPNAGGSTATADVPEGMALVDAAVLEELKAGAAAGTKASAQLAAQARDAAIKQALKDGKITAASKDKFVEAWDDEVKQTGKAERTQALLAALTPGLVPTAEVGHGNGGNAEDAEVDELYALVYGDDNKNKEA